MHEIPSHLRGGQTRQNDWRSIDQETRASQGFFGNLLGDFHIMSYIKATYECLRPRPDPGPSSSILLSPYTVLLSFFLFELFFDRSVTFLFGKLIKLS